MINPPFIARSRELQVLKDAIAGTANGTCGIVLLTGDPGIGKTRLIHEALGSETEYLRAVISLPRVAWRMHHWWQIVMALAESRNIEVPGEAAQLFGPVSNLANPSNRIRQPFTSTPTSENRLALFHAVSDFVVQEAHNASLGIWLDLQWAR